MSGDEGGTGNGKGAGLTPTGPFAEVGVSGTNELPSAGGLGGVGADVGCGTGGVTEETGAGMDVGAEIPTGLGVGLKGGGDVDAGGGAGVAARGGVIADIDAGAGACGGVDVCGAAVIGRSGIFAGAEIEVAGAGALSFALTSGVFGAFVGCCER